MGKFSSNAQLRAMIVGNSADEFVSRTTNVLSEYGVEFIVCRDVYSAVGELAGNKGDNVLVIGRVEQLSREKGRFFHLAGENGCACCCLADMSSARKYLRSLAAIETEAFVINEPEEVGRVVEKLLAESSASRPEKKRNDRASALNKDEFLTTRAERDALLGI